MLTSWVTWDKPLLAHHSPLACHMGPEQTQGPADMAVGGSAPKVLGDNDNTGETEALRGKEVALRP